MCDYCDVLGDQIANLREDLEQSEHEVSVVRDERDELDDKVAELEEQLDNLNSKYEDLEIERDEIEVERDQWKRELTGYDEDFDTLRQERDDLKREMDLVRDGGKLATARYERAAEYIANLLAKLPATADHKTIVPGMELHKFYWSPSATNDWPPSRRGWNSSRHTVEMKATMLLRADEFSECYADYDTGLAAMEERYPDGPYKEETDAD